MLDFNKIKTISIKQRKNKVRLTDLIKPQDSRVLLDSNDFNELINRIVKAYKTKNQVIFMIGAHVIKVGMSLLIIDLMKKGVINHIAMNGAGPIHDFELALIGETSEYVEKTIEDGTFGMIEETGRILNEAIKEGSKANHGMGYSIGKKISDLDLPNKEYSILYNAYKLKIPTTVHVAIGTDIIHQHASCDGAAIGKTTYQDFKIFSDTVSKMENGVILNIGSAVILPEVFLKALTISRNLGFKVQNITTANLDMADHYRPRENVVKRPTSLGGKGFIIVGRHEVTMPSLHRKIVNSAS
jgi:deoxyhypusine synthase